MKITLSTLVAVRSGPDLNLFAQYSDGSRWKFGQLVDCDLGRWVFVSNDEEFTSDVNDRLEPDYSLRERLRAIRGAWEARHERERLESEAEHHAENAWLRAAEYNPEHADEMAREDMMGLT